MFQDSVVTTIVKLCLKSLQEFARLQTFNRSGFQQIQLDIQFLRISIKDNVEDEAAVDFLLEEVRKSYAVARMFLQALELIHIHTTLTRAIVERFFLVFGKQMKFSASALYSVSVVLDGP
jgi:hypothetical protein